MLTGGAFYVSGDVQVTVSWSNIVWCQARFGGAVDLPGGEFTMVMSVVADCHAVYGGFAVIRGDGEQRE